MDLNLSIDEVLKVLGDDVEVIGSYRGRLSGIAPLDEAGGGEISFLSNKRYRRSLSSSGASVVLIPYDVPDLPREGCLFIKTRSPSLALARICGLVETQLWPRPDSGIHPTAVIDPSARVDAAATIGPLCTVGSGSTIGAKAHLVSHVAVGRGVEIGEETWVAPHVSVGDHCRVGCRCRIHAGAIIGSDGFGYEPHEGRLERLPQIGIVVLEDEVEIGANTTIDRARFAETRIGSGTKIDNLVQVGHNCQIGRHNAIMAQVGISGSTDIGDGVAIYGQAGLAGHIKIGDGSFIGGQTGVSKDLPPGSKVRGTPHMDIMAYQRMKILEQRLPEFVKRIERLEERIDALS